MNKRKDPENAIPSIEYKKHHSINSIENIIMRNLHTKYKFSSKEESYNNLIVNALIFNKNSHLVSIFKDSMIWDYIDEFLKRYYKKAESFERVPRFASFYKNYFKFFCKPTFVNFTVNGVIQDYNEQKAELYYNQNFKSKKSNNEMEDNEDIEDEKSSKSISKSKIEKTIFSSTIKENIDNNSIITVKKTLLNNESTMILPDNDYDNTIVNESGLLNQYSSEQSFVLLMNQMKNNKRKTKNVSASNIAENPSSITRDNNAKKSRFISYTNLCQKKNFQVIKQKNHTESQVTFKTSYNRSRNNKSNNLVNCLSSTNKNQNSNSNTKFKTFDIQKKNNFLKTQNVENTINRIIKQVNVKPHKKNNYSIDNISSKKKSLSSKKHSTINEKKTKETILKGIKAKKKIPSIPPSTNENIMKITLALLMNGSNTSNKNRLINSGKHIQSVNININNQININNNVQLSPKSINNKIMHNEKVDMNINSNLTHLLHSNSNNKNSASSNVLPTHNKKSRNKCGSYDISATNTGSINYCSYNTLDKKHFTSFMTKNATKTTSYNSKDKMKNLKFTSHQMINNNGKKIKVIPQKKTFGLQFKNGSSNTGKIATKVSSNNNKK